MLASAPIALSADFRNRTNRKAAMPGVIAGVVGILGGAGYNQRWTSASASFCRQSRRLLPAFVAARNLIGSIATGVLAP
jgi:hypothetical protein